MSGSSSKPLKATLAELHEDRRNQAVVGIVVTHAIWVAAIAAASVWTRWEVVAAAYIVTGFMQYRIVMSCHEAAHKTLLFPVRLNEIVGTIHCSMVGMNFHHYRRQHLEHHQAQRIDNDPDAYIYSGILRARPGWPRMFVWLGGMGGEIVEKIRQKLIEGADSSSPRRAGRHALAVVLAQLALLAAFTLTLGWWGYPLLWLAPLQTIALLINRTRVIIEHGVPHSALAPNNVADAEQETIDVLTNPIERFLFAPYSFNYHYAHHRIPSIPHYNNAKLSLVLDERETGQSRRVRISYVNLLVRLLWGRPLPSLARASLRAA